MKKNVLFYGLLILFLVGYTQNYSGTNGSGSLYAQDGTVSQKDIKKEKKKRMREAAKADSDALKRHHDIQTKATRKRMKLHLKETRKNVKNSHR